MSHPYNSSRADSQRRRRHHYAAQLRDYLLSATHPIGRFKARRFVALGFSSPRWEELFDALRLQPDPGGCGDDTHDPRPEFTISAILVGPTGRSAVVVSVWLIPTGGQAPRFVTAYPGDQL